MMHECWLCRQLHRVPAIRQPRLGLGGVGSIRTRPNIKLRIRHTATCFLLTHDHVLGDLARPLLPYTCARSMNIQIDDKRTITKQILLAHAIGPKTLRKFRVHSMFQ